MTASGPCPPPERRCLIGTLAKARGLRGDLKVVPLTWRPERFNDIESVWCARRNGSVDHLTIEQVRFDGGSMYIRFMSINDRSTAEEYVGADLFIDEADRDPLPEGIYYHDQLIGCEVVCRNYGALGKITAVIDLAANDIWIVQGPRGEVLIPAVKAMILSVDIPSRLIQVDLPEGLVEEDQGAH